MPQAVNEYIDTNNLERVDKVTTIKAIDDMNLMERDIAEIAYKAGTKASYILSSRNKQSNKFSKKIKKKCTWNIYRRF